MSDAGGAEPTGDTGGTDGDSVDHATTGGGDTDTGAVSSDAGRGSSGGDSDGDHLYAYGVVGDAPDLRLSVDGVAGAEEAYTVPYRSLSAVVSDVDTTEPERTDEAVAAHDEVLRRVMAERETVVPMQFGMAFEDERTLRQVLRGARRALRSALGQVRGATELGVKIIAPADGDVDAEAVRESVSETLDDLAVAATDDDLFSDRLLVNRSYLVDRDRRAAFDGAVDDLRARHPSCRVQYTGPWPPYNFVDVHVGTEGA